MRAGQLNRRLRLQKVVMTSDAEGVSGENWNDVDTVWAHVEPASGIEYALAGQTREKLTHKITIRWRPDVSPKMRFLYSETVGGLVRLFLILTFLDPDEEHRQLDCLCEEFITSALGAT